MARSHALVGSEKHVIVSKSSEMTVLIEAVLGCKPASTYRVGRKCHPWRPHVRGYGLDKIGPDWSETADPRFDTYTLQKRSLQFTQPAHGSPWSRLLHPHMDFKPKCGTPLSPLTLPGREFNTAART